MSDDILKEISTKLDIIIGLLVNDTIEGKNKIEATKILSDIGLPNIKIAEILGVKSNVVSARLSEAKKQKIK